MIEEIYIKKMVNTLQPLRYMNRLVTRKICTPANVPLQATINFYCKKVRAKMTDEERNKIFKQGPVSMNI